MADAPYTNPIAAPMDVASFFGIPFCFLDRVAPSYHVSADLVSVIPSYDKHPSPVEQLDIIATALKETSPNIQEIIKKVDLLREQMLFQQQPYKHLIESITPTYSALLSLEEESRSLPSLIGNQQWDGKNKKGWDQKKKQWKEKTEAQIKDIFNFRAQSHAAVQKQKTKDPELTSVVIQTSILLEKLLCFQTILLEEQEKIEPIKAMMELVEGLIQRSRALNSDSSKAQDFSQTRSQIEAELKGVERFILQAKENVIKSLNKLKSDIDAITTILKTPALQQVPDVVKSFEVNRANLIACHNLLAESFANVILNERQCSANLLEIQLNTSISDTSEVHENLLVLIGTIERIAKTISEAPSQINDMKDSLTKFKVSQTTLIERLVLLHKSSPEILQKLKVFYVGCEETKMLSFELLDMTKLKPSQIEFSSKKKEMVDNLKKLSSTFALLGFEIDRHLYRCMWLYQENVMNVGCIIPLSLLEKTVVKLDTDTTQLKKNWRDELVKIQPNYSPWMQEQQRIKGCYSESSDKAVALKSEVAGTTMILQFYQLAKVFSHPVITFPQSPVSRELLSSTELAKQDGLNFQVMTTIATAASKLLIKLNSSWTNIKSLFTSDKLPTEISRLEVAMKNKKDLPYLTTFSNLHVICVSIPDLSWNAPTAKQTESPLLSSSATN